MRSLNDWEEESVCDLLAILAAREIKAQVNDELVWPPDPKGSFNIKSFCNVVYDRPLCYGFPSTAICRSKAPPKACFFAWAAALDKVPTKDFLKRRNFHGPSRCVLCREEEETIHHLLVHCQWASLLWQLGLSMMGVCWVQPWKVKDVLVAWRRRKHKCLALGVWNLIPLAIWWSVWKERNRWIFKGKDLSLLEFKMYFLRILYTWSQVIEDRVNLTFVDFVDNLCKGIEGIRFFGFALVYVAAPPWCPFMV